MAELDGVWEVERTGGALPPLVGVRKVIAGSRGHTKVGGVIRLPFDVRDNALHYRGVLAGLVDELEPDTAGFRGRATFLGNPIGTFVLRRHSMTEIKDQLVKHIDEAYAMEQNVLRMLDSMVSSTDDAQMRQDLQDHKQETEEQANRLKRRLEAHDASPSMIREAGGILGALMKGVVDMARPERAGRNARDGYATEHMEIASYELLERVAQRAGDEETAEVARQNRQEEQAMAKKIEANWDKVAELSLKEEGVSV